MPLYKTFFSLYTYLLLLKDIIPYTNLLVLLGKAFKVETVGVVQSSLL